MGLTVVIGDRSAGKTGVLYERVRDAVSRGKRAALLLPTLPERDRAAYELAATCPTGLRIETLDSYLDELWSLAGDGRRPVAPAERAVLLEQALESVSPRLSVAMPLTYARRALRILVERAAERPAGSLGRPPSDPLARAIMTAVAEYERLLDARGLVEPAAARMAASRLATGAVLPDLVCVNRFETFTPPQEAFMRAAASIGSDVVVAVTYVEGSAATCAAERLVRTLAGLPGAEVIRVDGRPLGSADEIVALQASLASGVSRAVAEGRVRLEATEGARGEAAAAAQIVAEMADTGIPFEEIAVVARSMRGRARRLAYAMDALGIPWRYEGTWSYRDSGLGRAIVSLLRFVAGGEREHLASFLQSDYARISHDDADTYLRQMRSRRIAASEKMWRAAAAAPGEAGRIVQRAIGSVRQGSGEAAVQALCRIADEMMVSRHGEAPVLDREGLLDAKARNALAQAASAMVESTGKLDPASLAAVLEGSSITSDDAGPGVTISTAERIRSRRFEAVVLVGMGADEFPRLDAALGLPRRTLHALARVGIDAGPRVGLDEERLLFYQAVTAARQRLALVWQAVDDEGNEKDPSLFIDEIVDAYAAGRQPKVAIAGKHSEQRGGPEVAPGPVAFTASEAPHGAASHAEDAASTALADDLAQKDVFSASELEAYLRCPRRWFYERHLRPASIDVHVDDLRRGYLAHTFLQRFYEKWQELGYSRVEPGALHDALRVHDEVMSTVLESEPQPESLDEQGQIQRAITGTRRVVQRDALSFPGFAPIAHEVAFGTQERDAMEIDGWRLRGRIDRIDAGDAGLIVCDYKSGNGVAATSFDDERILQAPLYSLVAERLYGRPVVGMLYRTMSSGQDRGAYVCGVVSSPWLAKADAREEKRDLAELIEAAVQRASVAVAGIRAGKIDPRPYRPEACTDCIAHTWCDGSQR